MREAKRNLEKKLFDEWKEALNVSTFCEDGAVDRQCFFASFPRILFILKETNSPGKGFPLREFLSTGAPGGAFTFNNVARWSALIRKYYVDGTEMSWSELGGGAKFRKEHLQHIAVMNLKKSSGAGTAKFKNIEAAAHRDKAFIQKQFNLYEADIVICGGVFSLFKKIIDLENIEWGTTKRGWKYGVFGSKKQRFIIDSYHPAARTKGTFLAYTLLDTIKELRKKYNIQS